MLATMLPQAPMRASGDSPAVKYKIDQVKRFTYELPELNRFTKVAKRSSQLCAGWVKFSH
jgi:hypothetical protein